MATGAKLALGMRTELKKNAAMKALMEKNLKEIQKSNKSSQSRTKS